MNALALNTTGYENTAIGRAALYSNQPTSDENGRRNTAAGFKALYANTTGYENTALGYQAFQNGTGYYNSTALGYLTSITASDQVRIGNSAVTSIGGQVGWTTLSDARFKRNIAEDVPGLEFIMKLRPVTYNMDLYALAEYIGTPDGIRSEKADAFQNRIVYTGFIAQEVEEAARSVGFTFSGVDAPKNENDYYGLRYAEFTVPLVKAVQEQQGILGDHGLRILALESAVGGQQSAVGSWQLAGEKWQAEKDNFETRIRELEEENNRLRSANEAIMSSLTRLEKEVGELRGGVAKIPD
jgi:hypothetical protein